MTILLLLHLLVLFSKIVLNLIEKFVVILARNLIDNVRWNDVLIEAVEENIDSKKIICQLWTACISWVETINAFSNFLSK